MARKKIVDIIELLHIWYRAKKEKRRILKSEIQHFYDYPEKHPGCKSLSSWFYMCDNLYSGKGYGQAGQNNRQGMIVIEFIMAIKAAEKRSQATYSTEV